VSSLLVEELSTLSKARLVILVAHDPELAARADQVVYLEGGRLAGFGAHRALLAALANYRSLWGRQDA